MTLISTTSGTPLQAPYRASPGGTHAARGPHAAYARDHYVRRQRTDDPDTAGARQTFLAALPAGAVEAALAGRPVQIQFPGGQRADLTIAGTPGAYTVTIGANRFSAPTDAAGLERVVRLALMTPPPLRNALRDVNVSGQGVTMQIAMSDGSVQASRLTPGGRVASLPSAGMPGAPAEGSPSHAPSASSVRDVYTLTVPGACLSISAPVDRDVVKDAGLIAGLIEEQPAHLRGALGQFAIEPGANPANAFWAEKYKRPGFVAAATSGNGALNYWSAAQLLDEGTIIHEFGHTVAQHYAKDGGFVPDGWEAASKADGHAVSEYATASGAEDFAETWRVFSGARVGRPTLPGDPQTLAQFEARFPARAAIVEAIANGTRTPVTPIAHACAGPGRCSCGR